MKKEERQFNVLERFVEEKRRKEGTKWEASMYETLMEVKVVVRKDWEAVFRLWEEVQEGAGVNAKSVEMVSSLPPPFLFRPFISSLNPCKDRS